MPLYADPFSQALIAQFSQPRQQTPQPSRVIQPTAPAFIPAQQGGGGGSGGGMFGGMGIGDVLKLAQFANGQQGGGGDAPIGSPDMSDSSPFEMPSYADPSADLTSAPSAGATATQAASPSFLSSVGSAAGGPVGMTVPFVGPAVSAMQGRKKEAIGGGLGALAGILLAPFTAGLSIPLLTAGGSMIGASQED